MRVLIILGLIALVCSSPSFLRDLQEGGDTEAAPADSETAASTTENSTDSEGSGAVEDATNTTVEQPSSRRGISLQDFALKGIWELKETNCSILCTPKISIEAAKDWQSITFTLEFPTNENCGQFSGQTKNVTEQTFNGIWVDQDEQSPLFGYTGIYRLNNKTVLLVHNDTNDNTCWEEWGGIDSIVTNADVPMNKSWEGAWNATSWVSALAGFEDTLCCVPDLPVLVTQDLETQTISWAYRNPDCDACGTARSMVYMHNISIVGGGGFDNEVADNAALIYSVNDTVVYVTPSCAITFEMIMPKKCDNSTGTDTEEGETPIISDNEDAANGNSTLPVEGTSGEGETTTGDSSSGSGDTAAGGEGETAPADATGGN